MLKLCLCPVAWCLVALTLGTDASAGVVYNSQVSNQSVNGVLIINEPDEADSRVEMPGPITSREFDAQAGDAITLAGTDRFVTNFSVRLAAFQPTNFAASADVELNIYTSVGGLPGTLLWTGAITGVAFPASIAGVDAVFTPNITVPNSLVFAVALANVSNPGQRAVGIATHHSTFTGSSGMDVLVQNTASGAWRKEFYSTPFQHVQAKVTAVPAPAGATVIAAMGVTCLRRRR